MWSGDDSDKDWVRCASWLVRCQVLSRDHRSAQPNASLADLAHTLRDGVIICLLLNRLHARAIDPKNFSQQPQMSQFLCIKNIKTFLQTCKSVFGMADSELFHPSDLYGMKNTMNMSSHPRVVLRVKVVMTLSALSRTSVALTSNIVHVDLPACSTVSWKKNVIIRPFTLSAGSDCDSPGEKENYINLNDVRDEHDEQDINDVAADDDDVYTLIEQEEEDIYADLVALKPQKESTLPKSKHDMCVKELVDTEENYLKCLKMLCTDFMVHMKLEIKKEDFDKIFFLVEKLRNIHQAFFDDLVKACGPVEHNPTLLTIADCFIMNKEKLLIYGEYCSNLIDAQERLDLLCMQSTSLHQKVLDLQMVANQGRFKLRDLLSVPMQRVLKYHLLLRELIRHTDNHDMQKKSLLKALEETEDLSLCVNEVKRDNEALNALSIMQRSIEDLPHDLVDLKQFGRLQKDGELRVRFDKNTEKRHVFLLDQLLIICSKSRGDTYGYITSARLQSLVVDETVIKDWGIKKYGFSLRDRNGNEQYFFETVGDKKELNRTQWVEAIKLAQGNTSPPDAKNEKHDFVMYTFSETTICDVCRKLLRGVFFQGYRCQVASCNMSSHKDCLGKAKDMAASFPPWPTATDKYREAKYVFVGPPTKVPPRLPSRPSMRTPAPVSPVTLPPLRISTVKMTASSSYRGIPHPGSGRTPLVFENGEEIELLSEDGDWLKGKINVREGFFPRSNVRRMPVRTASYESTTWDGRRGSLPNVVINSAVSPPAADRNSFHPSYDPLSGYQWCLKQDLQVPDSEAVITRRNSRTLRPRDSYTEVSLFSTGVNHDTGASVTENLPRRTSEVNVLTSPWFAGNMSRDEATDQLANKAHGTYLIRMSVVAARKGEYALSINNEGNVKHMKVLRGSDNSFYLASNRPFSTLLDMVLYYQENSLEAIFPEVKTTLATPYKEVSRRPVPAAVNRVPEQGSKGRCRALYDYEATEPNQISLYEGDIINIINKAGESTGWWKGSKGGQVGYFPHSYVTEID